MRILEVTERYPPALGGVEIHVEAIARGLGASGHRVEVITTDLSTDRPFVRLRALPAAGEVPVRRHRAIRTIPAPHGLGIVSPGMAVDLWRSKADVVHAHAFGMSPTWIAAARRRGRPLIVETHMDAGRGTPGWRAYARAVARFTLGPADRVVAQTTGEQRLLISLGVAPEKISLIPDGVDLREFPSIPQLRQDSTGRTLLFVGRLYPEQKGLLPLVEAVARLPAGLAASLRLVGEDWGGRDLVLRRARDHGIADRVQVLGPLSRSALLEEYRRADVFVLPSLFEPYGIVLLEAMAAGLPIVASKVGGIPEVVEEGQTALLTPPGDVGALCAALRQLVEDGDLRARLGRAGRQRAQAHDWSRVVPQWAGLFEDVVGQAT
jgi:D-inositol-3-phosphate glycosyltransferase